MNLNDIIINKMVANDVEQVIIIENLSFILPWTRHSFLNELVSNKFAHYHVARLNGHIIGYAGLWKVLDEGHITNIAIHPDFRRVGIASKLVDFVISFCSEQSIASLTLEVRKSNLAAQSLYKKYGFVEAGIRKAYYSDNNEDAIIMWKKGIC